MIIKCTNIRYAISNEDVMKYLESKTIEGTNVAFFENDFDSKEWLSLTDEERVKKLLYKWTSSPSGIKIGNWCLGRPNEVKVPPLLVTWYDFKTYIEWWLKENGYNGLEVEDFDYVYDNGKVINYSEGKRKEVK